MTGVPFSVCVYCGSRNGVRPAYRDLALRLGTAIGRRGCGLTQHLQQRLPHPAHGGHPDGVLAFIAMPGGIGTFEELFEVWTWRHLAYHDRPIGLLDAEGYWAPMLQFLRHSVAEGFMGDDQMAMLHSDDQVERLLDTLATRAGDPTDDNFSRI